MPEEHSLTLHQADQIRTDIAARESDLRLIMSQFARLPTRKELARWALLAVPSGAGLAILALVR